MVWMGWMIRVGRMLRVAWMLGVRRASLVLLRCRHALILLRSRLIQFETEDPNMRQLQAECQIWILSWHVSTGNMFPGLTGSCVSRYRSVSWPAPKALFTNASANV